MITDWATPLPWTCSDTCWEILRCFSCTFNIQNHWLHKYHSWWCTSLYYLLEGMKNSAVRCLSIYCWQIQTAYLFLASTGKWHWCMTGRRLVWGFTVGQTQLLQPRSLQSLENPCQKVNTCWRICWRNRTMANNAMPNLRFEESTWGPK